MRATLCLLLATCVLAQKNYNRRTKPFVADAVGNTLPPPSNVPASVGSPVNLITPDRYEFYTFDESGELVKRLMTLEEIQAIVAAGEDSDGLVTFADDNQPTIAFNFSQPPFTKVHSVVTNVQNVLKAQMEAHKNKPQAQPTLDTPDVSDTWSLILPSIFGNTGVDIVPDKPTSGFTPETDTLESDLNDDDDENNSLSKEGGEDLVSSTTAYEDKAQFTEVTKPSTTTTLKPSTTTSKVTTTTRKPTTTVSLTTTRTTTTRKPTTVKLRTTKTTTTPRTTTTSTTPRTTTPSTTPRITTTSTTPRTTTTASTTTTKAPTTTTTAKPTTTRPIIRITPRTTTLRPTSTSNKPIATTSTLKQSSTVTEKSTPQFEKISTFVPVSTVKYVTERTTKKPVFSSESPASTSPTKPATTTLKPIRYTTVEAKSSTSGKPSTRPENDIFTSTSSKIEEDKVNITTVTTQSVSPSTSISSTEMTSSEPDVVVNTLKDTDAIIPLFDVAQSISQIASDLGSSYQPIPTSNNLLDTPKETTVGNIIESKEVLDMDIPSANEDQSITEQNIENFVKITTIDPHPQESNEKDNDKIKHELNKNGNVTSNEDSKEPNVNTEDTKISTEASTTENIDFSSSVPENIDVTTIDPILSGSVEDLLSQIVNENHQTSHESNESESNEIPTVQNIIETTTEFYATTSELLSTFDNDVTSTTPKTNIKNDINSENIVPGERKPTKEEPVDNSKGKINDKKEINKDNLIQVPLSNVDLVSKTNSNFKKDSGSNKISSNKNNIIIENRMQLNQSLENNKPNGNNNGQQITKLHTDQVVTTTVSPKQDTTTKLTMVSSANDKIKQSAVNKINSSDKNNIKKDKITETLPKMEEFKKKIQKVNIDDEELNSKRNNSWKLIPTVTPPKVNEVVKDNIKTESTLHNNEGNKNIILEFSKENQGLEVTTKDIGEDVAQFTELCNELAFRYWNVLVQNIDKRRSFVLSPYSITSMLAMMFMGARGATSGEMNDILKLDDMVTFNPHFTLKNISDSIETTSESGLVVSAFIRELYSDRNKGKILTFYKERAQHFYSGHVEEINFKLISDIIRRRTNLLVKRYTWGKIQEHMKTNSIVMKPPLAAFSANIFETDCTGSSVEGRDGEIYFVVSPNIRQRRLVPVPAVVYKSGFLAGYDPTLDATAAALGNTNSIVSTIFLMPGQQGNVVHSDDLEKLEQRLLEANPSKPTWNRLLRTLLPRVGLELQIPRFSHKSVFNVSSSLQEMGLKDLFDSNHADLGGLNGPSKDLYLSDMVQMSSFVTCGEGLVGDQHHVEEYPDTTNVGRRRTYRWLNDWNEPRDYQRAFHDPHDVGEAMHLPLHLRPRQARLPTRSVQSARLKFDRPFLFFVRHNPTGMILYVGRYNPRLLP